MPDPLIAANDCKAFSVIVAKDGMSFAPFVRPPPGTFFGAIPVAKNFTTQNRTLAGNVLGNCGGRTFNFADCPFGLSAFVGCSLNGSGRLALAITSPVKPIRSTVKQARQEAASGASPNAPLTLTGHIKTVGDLICDSSKPRATSLSARHSSFSLTGTI